jgi:hypothetical protein
MQLCVAKNNNHCLIKNEKTYTLAVYDKDYGRIIVWDATKHPQLTEFIDTKLFPDKK